MELAIGVGCADSQCSPCHKEISAVCRSCGKGSVDVMAVQTNVTNGDLVIAPPKGDKIAEYILLLLAGVVIV